MKNISIEIIMNAVLFLIVFTATSSILISFLTLIIIHASVHSIIYYFNKGWDKNEK